MKLITIGTKNQIVLPKEVRAKISGLKPGRKVMVYPINSNTVAIKVDTQSWAEKTEGIAAKAWSKINTTKYLEKLRDEWYEK